MSLHTPFRFDYVGSFLRPEDLKTARRQYEEGHISRDELRAVEDKEITDLVAKQKATGYHVITDGEFRRAYWHLDFMWGLQGIDHVELPHGYYFHGEETTHGTARCTGKISGENHPFVKDFLFVKQFEDENTIAKQTIPAPAQTLAELYREDNEKITRAIYPDENELIEDIAAAYRTVLRDLYEAGCRNVQFDDCTWGMLVDEGYRKSREGSGVTLEEEAERYLRVNNLALEGRPEDLAVNTHICRGNYHSTYACSGPYDRVADYVFARENVDALYLEYDDARSGPPREALSLPAVRLCLLRDRKQTHRRGAVGQARPRKAHRRARLGKGSRLTFPSRSRTQKAAGPEIRRFRAGSFLGEQALLQGLKQAVFSVSSRVPKVCRSPSTELPPVVGGLCQCRVL